MPIAGEDIAADLTFLHRTATHPQQVSWSCGFATQAKKSISRSSMMTTFTPPNPSQIRPYKQVASRHITMVMRLGCGVMYEL